MKTLSSTERIAVIFGIVVCAVLLHDLVCRGIQAAKAARADARIEQVVNTVDNVVKHMK